VISISTENDRQPPSAIIAGRLTVCTDGRSAITTPANPTRTALQPPADPLAQHDRRQRGDEYRTGEIAGDDVGERQIDGREKERRHFERGEDDADKLQPGAFHLQECRAMPPDRRRQHDQRRAGAQPQQLADRIGRDHEFSECVAEREHRHRQQHQANAGEARRAFVMVGRESGKKGHRGHGLSVGSGLRQRHSRSGIAAIRTPRYRWIKASAGAAQETGMTEFDPAHHRVVPEQRWFDDFSLGERFVIPSRTMTDAVFAAFQTASGDTHPVHYDVEYCRARGMPNLLAHGFQTLIHTAPGAGLFPFLVEESLVGFLEQSSRFLKPVYAGDTIYPALEVSELVPGRSTGVVILRSTVFNQRRELVLDGLQKFLIRRRPA